jgi:hypothetical protein
MMELMFFRVGASERGRGYDLGMRGWAIGVLVDDEAKPQSGTRASLSAKRPIGNISRVSGDSKHGDLRANSSLLWVRVLSKYVISSPSLGQFTPGEALECARHSSSLASTAAVCHACAASSRPGHSCASTSKCST